MKESCILVLIVLLSFKAFPQSDTAYQSLNRRIDQIQTNLAKSNQQYRKGANFLAIGAFVGAASTMTSKHDIEVRQGVIITGSLIFVIGSIIILDSHKYIGRAGNFYFTPSSVAIKF